MIYQKLRIGDPPYRLGFRTNGTCPKHKHPEVELFYCVSGCNDMIINKVPYHIEAGSLAIVGSMVSHELPETDANLNPESSSVVLEMGPTMLGNYFKYFSNKYFSDPIVDLTVDKYRELRYLFNEINELNANSDDPFSPLTVKGNAYKIAAIILREFSNSATDMDDSKEAFSIMKIESALEHIYSNYSGKLSVDEVAGLCGYSKSNFCKIFKQITGNTFHNVLNDYRIKMACIMLEDSNLSVSDIATNVGFADPKTFYRIFKATTGMTPTEYKKR